MATVIALEETDGGTTVEYYFTSYAQTETAGDILASHGQGQTSIGQVSTSQEVIQYGIFYIDSYFEEVIASMKMSLEVIDKSIEWVKLGWH